MLKIYIAYMVLFSGLAFVLYALDKKKAERGAWRTKEATLLGASFLGGAIGGYLAMFFARHKTKKWYFHFVNVIGIIWQAAVLVWLMKLEGVF